MLHIQYKTASMNILSGPPKLSNLASLAAFSAIHAAERQVNWLQVDQKKLATREANYYTFGGTDCSYVHVQMPPTGHYTELEIESKVLIRQISLSGQQH